MPKAFRSRKHWAFLVGLGVLAITEPAAADCAPEPQGEGRVTGTLDARTLRLDDGRIVRLSGLAPLRGDIAKTAEARLAALSAGRLVALHGATDAPDRYGRQHAWVFAENDERSLQAALIADGAGLRDTSVPDAECRAELQSAEKAARQARKGLWTRSDASKNAESSDDISPEIGHFSVVEGRVRSVRPTSGPTYLNFSRRGGFAAVVPKRAQLAFEAAGTPLNGFEGQVLRVRGYVMRRGGLRIDVTSPEQIEMAD